MLPVFARSPSSLTGDRPRTRAAPEGQIARLLFAGDHCSGLALEVDVRIPTHVDGDGTDRATDEVPRPFARVVVRDSRPAAADGEVRARDAELRGLSLDAALPDLLVAVIQRQDSRGDT